MPDAPLGVSGIFAMRALAEEVRAKGSAFGADIRAHRAMVSLCEALARVCAKAGTAPTPPNYDAVSADTERTMSALVVSAASAYLAGTSSEQYLALCCAMALTALTQQCAKDLFDEACRALETP